MKRLAIPDRQGFLSFLVYSNLFIAICAVLMSIQTGSLFLHRQPDFNFLAFVFFATLSSYSFHWILTPSNETGSDRIVWLKKHRWVHLALLISGVTGSVYYGLTLYAHWQWLAPAAVATFLYSAPKIPYRLFRQLRKIAYGKTIFLAFLWTYVTTMLPLLVSRQEWQTDFSYFTIARFFFIYAICVLFDYRDREYDRKIGIKSLITWLNAKGVAILFSASLVIYAVFSVWLTYFGFSLMLVSTLLLPGVLTALLFKRAAGQDDDMLYYFILDGLMALSSIITLLAFQLNLL